MIVEIGIIIIKEVLTEYIDMSYVKDLSMEDIDNILDQIIADEKYDGIN